MAREKKARAERSPQQTRLDPAQLLTSDQLLAGFGVAPDEWDVLLVGDGSGSGWNCSCGWACVLIDRATRLRKDLHGAMNAGTSYLAELFPYVQALSWYLEGPGKALLWDRLKQGPSAKVRVHVVSDSEIVARQGGGLAGRRKGRPYWAMVEALEGEGLETHWHWMGRNRLGLNKLCDYMAGLCRKSVDAVAAIGPPEGTTVYDYNPDPPDAS